MTDGRRGHRYTTIGDLQRAAGFMFVGIEVSDNTSTPTRSLEDRVADDLGQIVYDVPFGPAPPELPDIRDLSAYEAALAVARRTCPHDLVHQPLANKAEVDCLDCGRHLTVVEYYRERRERSR